MDTKTRLLVMLALTVVLLVGVLLGQVLSSQSAQAQPAAREWRECFSASIWHHDGAEMGAPNFRLRAVTLPRGWVPIGGAWGGGAPAVILCR